MIDNMPMLISLFFLFYSAPSCSSDFLLFIGAGGKEPKAGTIFDDAIKIVGYYAKRTPGITVDVALNGGHRKTEALVENFFSEASSKSAFLESDYIRLIKKYQTKLENNEMKSGDQLMIYIDSHGAQKNGTSKTHKIAASGKRADEFNDLSGANLVNLDELFILRKLAKEKGVKLAIVDASCHSGNTLELADENTCVISSTGPNHYGYGDFSEQFAKGMVKGKNLEEIFLEVRAKDLYAGLPMISTEVGVSVTNTLYEIMTHFLYHFEKKTDKLLPFLQSNSSEYHQCMADSNFNALFEIINTIEKQNTVMKKTLFYMSQYKNVDLGKLKDLLAKYKKSLDLARLKMRELDVARLNQVEVFTKQSYTWRELVTTDFNPLILKMQKRIDSETDELKINLYKEMKTIYVQAENKKNELMKTHPDLVLIPAKEKEIKKLIDSNYFINSAIAKEERKLYTALYKNAQQVEPSANPNPCQNFKI